jgi:hypothetical protein
MRIWSLNPRHLDRIGLVACWREALLAQAVLAERTRGYRHHPQLQRFRSAADPLRAIGGYLDGVAGEARHRGYRFDVGRILHSDAASARLTVTAGQLQWEWQHLGRKLLDRSPDRAVELLGTAPSPHPLFRVVPGDIEPWERAAPESEQSS